MNTPNHICDVLIIGGGPAGSTAASFLAMKGHQVVLLEKDLFPRDHVGESLLPFCYQILKELGVLDEAKQRFVRKPGVRFINPVGHQMTSWCFNRVIHDESYLSFQVTRSDFDKMLLDNSRKHGAIVKEQTKVVGVEFSEADGMVMVNAVGPEGDTQTYCAKFIVDASGRSTFIASSKGWRKQFEGLDRTALWTHWDGIQMSGGLEEGLSLIVYLGGDKKGWIWIFPLARDRITVGVVLNNQHIREQRALLEPSSGKDWMMQLYLNELGSSPFAQNILQGGNRIGDLRVEGNYSYYVDKENKYGSQYALIGDASTFIDPIFSSGIFLSMNGARLVSEAVHQKLTTSDEEGMEALTTAYTKINGAYGVVYKLIQSFYNPHAITFAEAATAASIEHLLHENEMAAGHFLLAGDFFDRHTTYEKFIDHLQKPQNYSRYKRTVLDRHDYGAETCGANPVDVFPPMTLGEEYS